MVPYEKFAEIPFFLRSMNPTTSEPVRRATPLDAIAYHEQLSTEWEGRYQKRSFQSRIAVLEECLEGVNLAGTQWLDAGCGTGTLSRLLAEKGCSVVGLDAAPGMIELAQKEAGGLESRLRFEVVETIAQLPNADAALDGILCSSVLEYVGDVERCLSEFTRVLKPGGYLLISVPNAESVIRRGQVVAYYLGRGIGKRWLEFVQYSKNEYTMGELDALLAGHGFVVKKAIRFGSPIPRWLQRRRLGGSLLMVLAVRL